MTKMALDLGAVALGLLFPGMVFGSLGMTLGGAIDVLAGTRNKWTKIFGLAGLLGGIGFGGYYLAQEAIKFASYAGSAKLPYGRTFVSKERKHGN